MKKIVLLGLIAIIVVACGKIEKGIVTIENKSTYPVDVEFAQNYSHEIITISANSSVECSWEQYFFCFIEKPNKNILRKEENKDRIIISNNDRLCTYKVMNGVPDLTILKLLDENQFILALPDGTPTNSISIKLGQSTINTFVPLSIKNVFFDMGTPFSIDGNTFYPIEKKNESYYFNKLVAGRLESKKINIDVIANEIIISN